MKRVTITEDFLRKLTGSKPIRDKITGKNFFKGDFQHDWQEFVTNRQNGLDEKLNTQHLSSEFFEVDSGLHSLLEQAANGDEEFISRVYAAFSAQQDTVSFMSYNKGFFEGIKFAMMAGQL